MILYGEDIIITIMGTSVCLVQISQSSLKNPYTLSWKEVN